MANVDSKTLELIAKLHALATNKGATEAEAATALAKMQALLFKHNISISDINLTPKQRQSSIKDERTASGEMIRKWFGSRIRANERQWPVTLAGHVARYNFCSTMVDRDFSHVWFVGTPQNIEAVRGIWEFAVEQVMALADAAYQDYRKSGGKVYYRIWRRNFANGCTARLGERLREEWIKLQQQNASTMAIVEHNGAALKEYIATRATGTTKNTFGKQTEGFYEGFAAGNNVQLGVKQSVAGAKERISS